uniref:Transmembrane protein 218 n=1 Tax=Pinguiococcus pyrenoidosus TaxID=172671 RepID=A0A7R9YCK5_9STRA|mmetsp:Transcript_19584/g.74116  ORF Transcript_19584/g.74116 Transcript_19584/m.74116 type:complete len:148 (+) Transcript_19584:1-444(+)
MATPLSKKGTKRGYDPRRPRTFVFPQRAKDPNQILGVGIGTFLVITFFGVAMLIFGTGLAGGKPFTGLLTGAVLFTLVTTLLVVAPRESRFVETEEENAEYSNLPLARGFLLILMALSCLAAVGGVCIHHAAKPLAVDTASAGDGYR